MEVSSRCRLPFYADSRVTINEQCVPYQAASESAGPKDGRNHLDFSIRTVYPLVSLRLIPSSFP